MASQETETTPATDSIATEQRQIVSASDATLRDWCNKLRGEPDVRVSIHRMSPALFNGQNVRGQCEMAEWISDADDMLEYIRHKWGGAKFKLQPQKMDPKTNRWVPLTNIVVEIAGDPLYCGKPIGASGVGTDIAPSHPSNGHGQDIAHPAKFSPQIDSKALEIIERTSSQRASAAEESATARVSLLSKQLDDARDEIKSLRERIIRTEADAQKLLADARRDVDAARERSERLALEYREATSKELLSLRDAHRLDSDRIRDLHLQETNRLRDEISKLRDESRKEADSARQQAHALAQSEIQRIREDAKDRLSAIEKAYEHQLRDKKEQIDRLYEEKRDLDKRVAEKDDPLVGAQKLHALKDALTGAGLIEEPKEETTFDKVLGAMPEIAEAAPAIAGAAGSLFRNALGMPMAAQQQPQPTQQQALAMQQAAMQQAARNRQQQQARKAAAKPQPTPEQVEAVKQAKRKATSTLTSAPMEMMAFKAAIGRLELAIAGDTPPQSFANGLTSTTSHEILARIAAYDPADIINFVEQTSESSVLTSLRGKQYLAQVLQFVRDFLSRQAAVITEEPTALVQPEAVAQQPSAEEPEFLI